MKNFLISGMGRSGSMFLARQMNRSKVWTVEHEPFPFYNGDNLEVIRKRFDRDYYGEVNSTLRKAFEDIEVEKKGVLVRNPYNVALSIFNRRRISETRLGYLEEGAASVLRFVASGVFVIRFEKMTTDLDYLKEVLEHFEITDVDMTEIDLSVKVNSSSRKQYKSLSDLPLPVLHKLDLAFKEFMEILF